MSAEETRNLFLSRNTMVEMVRDRKYATAQNVLAFPDFTEAFPFALSRRSTLSFVALDSDRPVAVHFSDDEKMGKKALEALMEQYERENIFHIVLVVPQTPSPAVVSMIQLSVRFHIEVFTLEELRFNKTKHSWVPMHRVLSPREKREVLEELKIRPESLPKILKNDVMARYLGARQDDVIEIIRASKTAGESIYYRIVVDRQR
jgi:DNA-directed RNA polymerases I, II, and III subunit RPABC1